MAFTASWPLPDPLFQEGVNMVVRAAKVMLVFGIAVFYTLIVLNNITDWDSNYQFVRHVMMMDSTFPGNHEMWRAIHAPALHKCFYLGIIAWEFATAILFWWGGVRLLKAVGQTATEFDRSKGVAVLGFTMSLLMWLVAFITVGGEWFLMWQSRVWNGEDTAFRLFTVAGILLLILMQRDAEVGANLSR